MLICCVRLALHDRGGAKVGTRWTAFIITADPTLFEARGSALDWPAAVEELVREFPEELLGMTYRVVVESKVKVLLETNEPATRHSKMVTAGTESPAVCPDCKGTRVYRGLLSEEPCRTCSGWFTARPRTPAS